MFTELVTSSKSLDSMSNDVYILHRIKMYSNSYFPVRFSLKCFDRSEYGKLFNSKPALPFVGNIVVLTTTLFLLGFSTSSLAEAFQTRSSGLITHPATSNEWQTEARPPKATPRSPEAARLRTARDAYADKVYGLGIPVDKLQDGQLGYRMEGTPLATGESDLPLPFPDEVVIVGSFDSHDVVLSASRQSIYSEMHIAIDRVLFGENQDVSAGKSLDILTAGGTVFNTAGKNLSFKAEPRGYGLTPGHRYILFLKYIPAGNFYLLGRSIELANGGAQPNFPDDDVAALSGHWRFAHQTESQVIDAVQAAVQAQHR